MRWAGALSGAILALFGCAPSSREPPIDQALTAALDEADSLPNCPSQKQEGTPHYDCGVCRQREIIGDHRFCNTIRYIRPPGAQRDTVVFEYVSVEGGPHTYLTVPDVDPQAHAFDTEFTRDSRADIVPIVNVSGERKLAVWVSRWHKASLTSERVRLDDLPYGRLVPWRPECRLIALSEPGVSDPWRLTLYRVQNLDRYDKNRAAFEPLGKLEAMRKPDGSCEVTGAAAIAMSGMPAKEFDREICQWLDDAETGVTHHISDCKGVNE